MPKGVDFFPIPGDIFQSLCIDFLELPPSDGKNYIMVVVCRLSGYIVAIPCSKDGLTSEETAKLFLEHCVHFMGLPCEIVSECDTRLTSQWFLTLCTLLGIEQHIAIIYRPKGNGRAEAAVRAVVQMLRLTLEKNPGRWTERLPWAVYYINALPGLILPHSPHKIVFGRDTPFIGDLPVLKEIRGRSAEDCVRW